MINLTVEELDQLRINGLRPTVVGCFLNKKRTLMLYHKEYDLWQFPQGGVQNKEIPEKALSREMREEIGEDLLLYSDSAPQYLGIDQIMFKGNNNNDLQTDDGKNVKMKGKAYLFYSIEIPVESLDMEPSEFDEYKWCSYEEAMEIVKNIYQPGKQRITERAIELLYKQGLII